MINPREFIRRLVKVLLLLSITLMSLMNTNKLNLNEYFGNKTYKLNEINKAIQDLKRGKIIRPLIKM